MCALLSSVQWFDDIFSKILQVMRVAAPWLRKVVLDDRDDGNYVIPNLDSVVVGGTHQDGDWDRVGCQWQLAMIPFAPISVLVCRLHVLRTRISSWLEGRLSSQACAEQLI